MGNLFAAIPGVDICKISLLEADPSLKELPLEVLRVLITKYWDLYRDKIKKGLIQDPKELELSKHLKPLLKFILKGFAPKFKKVLNGTGVVIHTNLGRSVLSQAAYKALEVAALHYNNLELDLSSGQRGSRYAILEELLAKVTGAEAGMVVNNNAAAVMLILDTFCQQGEVVLSRGELVEIGGSFRIPEVMLKSGAILREVGTTNRTHLSDFAQAINPQTKALMRVHTSNYRIIGFHSQVELKELSELAKAHHLLLIEDLGSGSLVNFDEVGLSEPLVQETVALADLVSFSGDKVLGGPQAGIIVGKAPLIEALKKNQLTRALRVDKLRLAALEATLRSYLDLKQAKVQIPTLARILESKEELALKASKLAQGLKAALGDKCQVSLQKDVSRVGGGAFPQYDLPTTLVALKPKKLSPLELKKALLKTSPPLLGRLEEEAFCLDPRTLELEDFFTVFKAILEALA